MILFNFRAIEFPHPGMSYNPTLEAHQELLQAVKVRESKIIKHEEHLDRVTTSMFNKMPAVERDIFKLKELRSGIDDDDDVDDENESIDDEDKNEFIAVNPPVEVKKKDKKARRKQKEQREMKQKLLEKKMEKKKIADINR